MPFADKLKELREKKQLLQRQLASALEIDTPMYSRIERGERKPKESKSFYWQSYLVQTKKSCYNCGLQIRSMMF